jgi:DNA-binding transcriptional regulator YiaG
MSAKKKPEPQSRPFPWLCSDCVTRTVVPTVIDFTAKVKHDAVIHELHLPGIEVPRCQTCGDLAITTAIDERVNEALRAKLHLLSPAQIRANIEKLDLTQQELADWLDVAPETVSRWMTGTLIQSSRMNKRLRMFFAFPTAREMLRRLDEDPQLGIEARVDRDRGEADRTGDPPTSAVQSKPANPVGQRGFAHALAVERIFPRVKSNYQDVDPRRYVTPVFSY